MAKGYYFNIIDRPETITSPVKAHLLQRRVNGIAHRQDSLTISAHALRNMAEREISFRALYRLFRDGVIRADGRPQTTKRGQEIRFRIDRVIDSRPLAAIAVIAPPADSNIFVITVMQVTTATGQT